MTLCLMVYNLSEYFLHQELSRRGEAVKNQVNKQSQRPSMSYVYRLFEGVQVLQVKFGKYFQEIVINLLEELGRIIMCFGSEAEKIYGLSI